VNQPTITDVVLSYKRLETHGAEDHQVLSCCERRAPEDGELTYRRNVVQYIGWNKNMTFRRLAVSPSSGIRGEEENIQFGAMNKDDFHDSS
jgi:hypothetical protein